MTFNWSSTFCASAARWVLKASAWRWTCTAAMRNCASRSSLASLVTPWRIWSNRSLSWSTVAVSSSAGASAAACAVAAGAGADQAGLDAATISASNSIRL